MPLASRSGDLQDVFKVSRLGTDAQVVENGITVLVLELGSRTLLLDNLVDGIEVLATTGRSITLLQISTIVSI